jgi:hypothetical protein
MLTRQQKYTKGRAAASRPAARHEDDDRSEHHYGTAPGASEMSTCERDLASASQTPPAGWEVLARPSAVTMAIMNARLFAAACVLLFANSVSAYLIGAPLPLRAARAHVRMEDHSTTALGEPQVSEFTARCVTRAQHNRALAMRQVDLYEEESGRKLPCFLAATLEYEGSTYAALYPVDAPVSLAEMVGERLMPLEDERETDALVAAASKACAEADITLHETPVVLTASGPGLDFIEDEEEPIEFADNEDDDEGEEALVLAQLDDDGAEVLVVQTLDPLYVVGKRQSEDPKRYTVPSDAEIDAISDTIEQLVVEFEEALDMEDDLEDDGFAA